jgi:hypothetical protein
MISTDSADAIEKVRNAIEPYSFSTIIFSHGDGAGENVDLRMFLDIRKGLLIGMEFTMDWPATGLMAVTAGGLILLVTALTLASLAQRHG